MADTVSSEKMEEELREENGGLTPVLTLKPRNEGEELKITETVIKKRKSRSIARMAERALSISDAIKYRRKLEHRRGIVTLESLVLKCAGQNRDRRRVGSLLKKVEKSMGGCFVVEGSADISCPLNTPPPDETGKDTVKNVEKMSKMSKNSEKMSKNTEKTPKNKLTQNKKGIDALPRTHVRACIVANMNNMSKRSRKAIRRRQAVNPKMLTFHPPSHPPSDSPSFQHVNDHILLLIRNKVKHASLPIHKLLKTLRLDKPFAAVFVPNTDVFQKMIHLINPFVIYGFPSHETIRSLFLKKGKLRPREETKTEPLSEKQKSEELILSDNRAVEERLGHLGIFCVDDLAHHVETCGPNFTAIQDTLDAFDLCDQEKVKGQFNNRICYGNFDRSINSLIQDLF